MKWNFGLADLDSDFSGTFSKASEMSFHCPWKEDKYICVTLNTSFNFLCHSLAPQATRTMRRSWVILHELTLTTSAAPSQIFLCTIMSSHSKALVIFHWSNFSSAHSTAHSRLLLFSLLGMIFNPSSWLDMQLSFRSQLHLHVLGKYFLIPHLSQSTITDGPQLTMVGLQTLTLW